MHKKSLLLLIVIMNLVSTSISSKVPESARSKKVISRVSSPLAQALKLQGLELGSPVYFRVFKQESTLEAWVQETNTDKFKLFKTYPICTFSGKLGPKLKEGDLQSPEGFYFVKPNQMNPNSRFHLSFNLGFPNAYDRYHQRTGSALMIHGNCVSIGCYTMTDPLIEEIYILADAALNKGQPFFRVHAFPFRMSQENMKRYKNNQWFSFWENLKEGYDYFEKNKFPPNTENNQGSYIFN
ncbi:2-dehydro-3-deoxyphosphooctonate aldolase [Kangiella sp. HZ709]|nr:2-dehydro-3-deoxyphosphooctonate aldolase [Kangiella sp. HZ709]